MKPNESLISHAPIQLRNDTEDRYERHLALLAAEGLRVIEENLTNQNAVRIDVWNAISAKVERTLSPADSIDEQLRFQLKRRYGLLRELGLESDNRIAILDSDAEYRLVVLELINKGIESGIFRLEYVEVAICADCSYIITFSNVNICSCPNCESKRIESELRQMLLLYPTETDIERMQKFNLVPRKGVSPYNITNNLQKKIIASKQRKYGTQLDDFGLEGFVLDPKIGLGMIGAVLETLGYGTLRTYVQGRDSLLYSLPFLSIFSPNLQNIIFTSLINPKKFEEIDVRRIKFYARTLPLLTISAKANITNEHVRDWSVMHTTSKARLDTTISVTHMNYSDIQGRIEGIWRNLFRYRIEESYKLFNLLVKDLANARTFADERTLSEIHTLARIFISYDK